MDSDKAQSSKDARSDQDETDVGKSPRGKGWVYMIAEIGTDLIKVGLSEDPSKRLKELQTGDPHQLIIEGQEWVHDMQKTETQLHHALRQYKSPLGGGTEWYSVRAEERVKFEAIFHQVAAQNKMQPI